MLFRALVEQSIVGSYIIRQLPRFDVNPNTGEPLGRNRRMISTDITIQHSAMYPSHIVLPIAPARP